MSYTILPTPEAAQQVRFGLYDQIDGNANIEGVSLQWRWNMMEGDTQGDYSAGIALLRAELEKLKSMQPPKRLYLRVYEERYNESNSAVFPEYIRNGPCIVDHPTHAWESKWRSWDPACMDPYINMLNAYAAEFDNDPYFEGIAIINETVIPPDIGAGYTFEASDAQWRRLMSEMKQAWPHTNVIMPINWHNSAESTADLTDYAASIGVGAGEPDTCPGCPSWGTQALNGETNGHDYRGEIPILQSVESSEMGWDSVGPDGGFTAQEIYDYANGPLHASHLMWDRNESVGTPEQRWSTGILPLINSTPMTNTACPSVYLD